MHAYIPAIKQPFAKSLVLEGWRLTFKPWEVSLGLGIYQYTYLCISNEKKGEKANIETSLCAKIPKKHTVKLGHQRYTKIMIMSSMLSHIHIASAKLIVITAYSCILASPQAKYDIPLEQGVTSTIGSSSQFQGIFCIYITVYFGLPPSQ